MACVDNIVVPIILNPVILFVEIFKNAKFVPVAAPTFSVEAVIVF